MSSQITESNSIERLTSLSDLEFGIVFQKTHTQLLEELKNGHLHLPVIKAYKRFYKNINIHIADKEWRYILQSSVPALRQCFSRNITEAKNLQCETSADLLKGILQENINVLESLDSLITALTQIQDISLELAATVPNETISIILLTFEYCKNISQITNEEVTQLFKTCYSLLCHYFLLLHKLKINCQYANQFNILTEILEKMYQIGTIVVSLDLKTMAELWKGYTQILKTYSESLRNEIDISKIIRFLIKQITEQVVALYDNSDEKLLNLTSKISVFLLKIVVKLCEYFSNCFGNCIAELFEFAIFLYKHARCFSNFSNINTSTVIKIDTYLLPGVDPLLNELINQRQFVSYYLNLDLSLENALDQSAFMLLLSLILKKLLSISKEKLHWWINDEHSIINHVFATLRKYHKTLCYDFEITITCLDANASQEVTLYDALLVNFSALIVNEVSCEKFCHLETTLLSNLFNSPPSVKIFVSDLWCILARYGTSELCFQHITILQTILTDCSGTSKVFLRSLIKRLFSFLSLTHQLQIISTLPLDDMFTDCYTTLGQKYRHEISQKIITENINKYKNLQVSLKQKFHYESYRKMINLIHVFVNLQPNHIENHIPSITDFVTQSWKHLSGQNLLNWNLSDFKLFISTLPHLSTITRLISSHLQCSHIIIILQSIADLLHSDSSYVHLCCLRVLDSLQTYNIESHYEQISTLISNSFAVLLQNRDVIVKQQSLDTFVRFSHVTKHENIISLTVSKDKSIATNVAAYLQRNPSPSQCKNLQQYFDTLIETAIGKQNHRDHCDDQPIKRIKLQDDFCDVTSRVENHIEYLINYLKNNQLTDQQRQAAERVSNCLEKFKTLL